VFERRAKDFMPLDHGAQRFSKDFGAKVSRNRNQALRPISCIILLRSPELLLPWREAKPFNYVAMHIFNRWLSMALLCAENTEVAQRNQ